MRRVPTTAVQDEAPGLRCGSPSPEKALLHPGEAGSEQDPRCHALRASTGACRRIEMLSPAQSDPRVLVVHVVYRFDVGGLENGIVNLVNHMAPDRYRHAIVALTDVADDFRQRIRRDDVLYFPLRKGPGHGFRLYPALYRLFRQLRPTVVHTRNLAALEAQIPAWLARVPVRLHGEHGRDVGDLDGSRRRYQLVRRAHRPFVQHYFTVSRDLADYLKDRVGIPGDEITQVYNGVDLSRFFPAVDGERRIAGCPFGGPGHWLVGTVGRMQHVKDQTLLARAFVRALELQPALRTRLRLVMIGDGPLRAAAQEILAGAGVGELAWLPGERTDVPDVMRGLDCFVLPSLAEGISNTILEAMASGLPVIATDVGGNGDLVVRGTTGEIVAASDVDGMAQALLRFAADAAGAGGMGRAGRAVAEQRFSIQGMVRAYSNEYERHVRGSVRHGLVNG
jgi:sugar transferase (PEP-CTERM/EpsH1 system associated)